MKKGFLTLMVALLTLVGAVTFGAVPQLIQIPDIQIGNLEDQATSPYLFRYSNAFNFDNYVSIASTGTFTGVKIFYQGEAPTTQVITINGKKSTDNADVYAISNLASFVNIKCSPPGGTYTPNPVMPAGKTSTPIVVTLCVQNKYNQFARNTGSFAVITLAGGYDKILTFDRIKVSSEVLTAATPAPAWFPVGYNLSASVAPPAGIKSTLFGHSTTGGFYLSNHFQTPSLDTHNEFGFWSLFNTTNPLAGQALIPYTNGNSYIATAKVWAQPHVTTTATDPNPNKESFVPWIRLRMDAGNESCVEEMDINPYGTANIEVSTNPAQPTTEVLVWDPRDQISQMGSGATQVSAGTNKVYFSFDLIDFNARNALFIGSEPQEGTAGLVELDIDTFNTAGYNSVFGAPSTVATYPASGTFAGMLSAFSQTQAGYGGTAVLCMTDASGDLELKSINVARGFGIFQLTSSALAVTPNTSKWYLYQFYATLAAKLSTDPNPSAPWDPYWLRLRVFYGDSQRSVNYSVRAAYNNNGTPNTYQFNNEVAQATAVYNVFFVPKVGENYPLYWAFDYIDFDTVHGDAAIALSKVVVKSFTKPSFK